MITRQEAIKRLEELARGIVELKTAFEKEGDVASARDQTQAFLDKCGGWEDPRSAEEIVAEIYSARTASNGGATIFDERTS